MIRNSAVTSVFAILLTGSAAAQAQDDGQWTMPGKDYASTRYSGLAEITAGNAGSLRPVWTFSTGVLAGHEGQPLVVKNTMYVVTPWPNVLYAFDLTHEGYPLKWKYRPDVSRNAIGMACCDAVNRGAVFADGKVIYNLLDGHTVAVDAATGREVWKTRIADLSEGETTPMAPLVVNNRVIVGASGGEFGIYGWIKGLDLRTGRIAWTAHNIGPDTAVRARPGTFKPHYDSGSELGLTTWPKDAWKTGGAPVWGWISYDPALDLLYYGTGNPAPYNPEQRPGDNNGARRPCPPPVDGSLVWATSSRPTTTGTTTRRRR
jgi:PQQ-dependent dehydrogenase (methanol/ethanol family)